MTSIEPVKMPSARQALFPDLAWQLSLQEPAKTYAWVMSLRQETGIEHAFDAAVLSWSAHAPQMANQAFINLDDNLKNKALSRSLFTLHCVNPRRLERWIEELDNKADEALCFQLLANSLKRSDSKKLQYFLDKVAAIEK